jgi:hypothetical protein
MSGRGILWAGNWLVLLALAWMTAPLPDAQQINAAEVARAAARHSNLPPRALQAQRFLAQRGWTPGRPIASRLRVRAAAALPETEDVSGTATWQPLGPAAVTSQNYGLVTGRISALALDPSDTTGDTLYVGTTGGGVWMSQNANTSNSASVAFTPLTDNVFGGDAAPLCKATGTVSGAALDASISIGALAVQPGGTGVILAGTGDPNDALDSYYGAGILRSNDSGTTWCLISTTSDLLYSFTGEGFAGFAWSTANTDLVVAAVSQAYEGTLVNAIESGASYQGLYYSSDGGASWSLATITDGAGKEVQGPNFVLALPDGNAATSVVWNPVRKLFIAAVRYHGYYQSTDGKTFTRITDQPGTYASPGPILTTAMCPANTGLIGSPGCPIFRGVLAVNPQTGDTFAWTVDEYNQDQGLWQDECGALSGACASATLWTSAQALQWNTAALETDTLQGAATIQNGDYNLALAAVPSGQETMLLAGANDLWQTNCPYSQGCRWRNTTNSTTCMSAQVGEYQHALEWNASNPLEILVGNDSGLWRSVDGISESTLASPEPVCSSTDASHFQNLNGSLGSLAEVVSIPQVGATPYTMMAGLGVNGTAGVKSATGTTAEWPEILGGEGGPVAIDPNNSENWYVNNAAGVSIHLCSQSAACTPTAFGSNAVVTDTDVSGDGLTMASPAPFLVDPLDTSKLLIGTCRVWRGPASGVGWGSANAVSPILDGIGNSYCSGDALIRSMAAMALPASTALASGGEVIYVGMYGSLNGGATLPGHVLSATYNSATSAWSTWADLTPATEDISALNYSGLDISSIFIDTHDTTGKTVYATVAGIRESNAAVQKVYRSTDGGQSWTNLTSNLPVSPVNSLVVDPQDDNTVYVGTDEGVYSTRQIANCASQSSECWSPFGSGLPSAPVVEVSAAPVSATMHDLVAATYGRGIWMAPLWTSGEILTTAAAAPASLTFASQAYGSASSAQTVTLTNNGSVSLAVSSIVASGDFSETDRCQNAVMNPGGACAISVTFTPTATGSRTGTLTIYANVTGGQMQISLSGTGTSSGTISLTPSTVSFGGWEVGTPSTALQVTATNSGSPAIAFTSAITGAFSIVTNACGTSVPAETSCNLTVIFTPVQAGAATGTLTFTDAEGTQAVALSGTGLAPPTDTLSATSLTYAGTIVGQLSAAQTVTLTNSGGVPLNSIAVSVSGAFQQTNACTANLAANSSCAISVVYAPTQTGSQTGTLTVSDALHTQTVALAGTGIAPPALAASPSSLIFTEQQVGVVSSPQTLTISDTGGASLANVGFQITGASAASFSTGTTTCGATLASAGSCTVQVIFTPATAGGSTASLGVSSSTPGVKAVSVPLTGTGQTQAGLNVSPSQLVFPIVAPGQSSASQTVTITNTGLSAATSLTLAVTPPFSLAQNTCGTTLAAGASCSTGVVFSPSLNGSYTGTLTIASASLAASATVALSGTGGTPGSVQASPSLIDFSQTGVGLLSSPVTVTLTNPSATSSLSSFAVAVTAGFKVVNNACPSTLAAGASCTVGVEFVPASAGTTSGSLTAGSSALATGASVPLAGMGFDFSVTLSGSSSQTISSGQTAGYTLVITPLNGSSGSFTLACASLPSDSTCTFNPASESIPANTTGNEQVEIATGQSTSSAHLVRSSAWPVLSLACGLLLVPVAFRRRRRALLLVVLLALLAGGVSSCTSSGIISGSSGGAGGHTTTGTTAAGTYSIPITVTSNGVQHQVTLTLTVD